MPIVTYECIVCGKQRTAPHWRFKQPRDEYMCRHCRNKAQAKDPIWLENCKLGAQKRSQDPMWKENNKKATRSSAKNPVYKENHKKIMQELAKDPTWLANQKVGAQKRESNPVSVKNRNDATKKAREDPTWLENQIIKNKKMASDPIWLEKTTTANKKKIGNPKFKENCKKAQQKKLLEDPEFKKNKVLTVLKNSKDPKWIESVTVANREKAKDPIWKECHLISLTGQGFWYGHPILHQMKNKIYCELWNRDLWNRIDAAWDFKSAISGETKEDNKGRDLDRHHVYWQEKACCKWDEDTSGYYAMINIGTHINPTMYKHYIRGDPNKFVLLTKSEHQIIKGNKKLGTTKLTWIKFFENLIEAREKEGKKCYLSKEEYKIYKNNNIMRS